MALGTNNGTNCNCYWGIAVVDENGGCTCADEITAGTGGIKVPPKGIKPITNRGPVPPFVAMGTQTAPATDFKIFGLSPIAVLGVAAVAIFLLGSDGKS
jgi:hypothetical protein